jgi:hypothetical protein
VFSYIEMETISQIHNTQFLHITVTYLGYLYRAIIRMCTEWLSPFLYNLNTVGMLYLKTVDATQAYTPHFQNPTRRLYNYNGSIYFHQKCLWFNWIPNFASKCNFFCKAKILPITFMLITFVLQPKYSAVMHKKYMRIWQIISLSILNTLLWNPVIKT